MDWFQTTAKTNSSGEKQSQNDQTRKAAKIIYNRNPQPRILIKTNIGKSSRKYQNKK